MSWARTLRIDGTQESAERCIASLRSIEGVHAQAGATLCGRTYVLAQGSDATDPAEVAALVPGRWYDEAILVMAIEPQPTDALPLLQSALSGAGAPAGVVSAEIGGGTLLVESAPRTSPQLLLAVVDTELRRRNGTRRVTIASPLTDDAAAAIAAEGLQAPEIGTDRILESLIGRSHVE